MRNKQQIEELVQQVFRLLPENIERSKQDIEKNIRAALSASIARMNLVTREEFDIQSALLARTRIALDELESKITDLEQQHNKD